ncbi:MAG: phosphopentomutase [Balneolaceae bacterium]
MGRFFLTVIDGFGVGAAADAPEYGDETADTLGHVCEQTGCELPNFQQLGLGNIKEAGTLRAADRPLASWGRMQEISAGKDSTTGHWEIAGIHLDQPFPTFPDGFPQHVLDAFARKTGTTGVLCNKPYSGTDVIRDYGEEHLRTGQPIVYTSADSVFQVACHVDVTDTETLHDWCRMVREEIAVDEIEVGRVIARPFEGSPGEFERISEARKDFSAIPPEPNLPVLLQQKGINTYSIGKVLDLFAGNGFSQYRKTRSNAEGLSQLLSNMSADIDNSFVFTNLIDTDQVYGHRQDPEGYARCLQELDRAIPSILSKLQPDDLFLFTSDHGNDPCDDSTDHTREYVPLLVIHGKGGGRPLGMRETFSDIAATALHYFDLAPALPGTSFLDQL